MRTHQRIVVLASMVWGMLWGSTAVQAQTVVSPFAERLKIEGQLEIKMIGAPTIEPAFLNATAAASNVVKVDSLLPYEAILRTGSQIANNNDYQWLSTASFPLTINCPKADLLPCASAYTVAANKSCPLGKWSSSPLKVTKTIGMTFADYDTDMSTFSSSRASFQMSGCQCKVKKAYLYWFGCDKNVSANVQLSVPTKSYSGTGDVDKVSSTFKTILFKAPGGAYTSVTADVTYNGLSSTGGYVCVKEVSSLLTGVSKGDVWVANVQSFLGRNSGGSYSGWALVLIYESPNYPPRSISLWDGYFELNGSSKTISLTGLTTPASTNFKSYIGFGCLDGENFGSRSGLTPENLNFKAGGSVVQINPMKDRPYILYNSNGEPSGLVKDACNIPQSVTPTMVFDGVSSSHITSYDEFKNTNGNEIDRTPSGINTLGLDLHHILLPQSAISPSATQADLTFFSGEQGGTMPFLSYIAIETLQPKLELSKEASVVKTALSTTFTYTLKVKNTGGLKSLGVQDVITDALDAGLDYVPNSAKNAKTNVKLTGVTQSGNTLTIPIPAIASGDEIELSFEVKVKDYTNTSVWLPSCKDRVTNLAWIQYYSPEGILYKNISNATACDIGSETLVWIDDAQLGNSNVIDIGPIDITTWSTDSLVVPNVRRYLKGRVAANLVDSFLVIDESSFLRVSSTIGFDRAVAKQSYKLVYRNGSGSSCLDAYRVTYVINAKPTFVQDTVQVRCAGEANGAIGVTASYKSGSGTIKYTAVTGTVSTAAELATATVLGSQAMSSVLSFSVKNLKAGNYTIVAEDAVGNLYYLPYTVSEPKQLRVALAAEDTICVGATANVTVSILSGASVYKPFTYRWQEKVDGGTWAAATETTAAITRTPSKTSGYTIEVADSACIARDTVTVVVNPLPILSLKDTTICANGSATISAATHDGYSWSTGATTASISANVADIYKVTVTDKGCTASAQMTLAVTALPTPNMGADRAVCDSVTLTAGGVFDTYIWSSSETTAKLFVNKTGSYAVEVSKSGCSASDTVNITVYQTPNFSIGGDTAICAGQSMTLNAGNNAGSYKWSTNETSQKITVSSAATYSVTITVGSTCSSSASRKVSIKALPVITISGNTAVCPNTELSITASGADSFVWDDASTAATRSLKPAAATNVTLTGTSLDCVSDTSFTVSVKPLPTVNASDDQTICWGKSATISASGTATDYVWDNGLGAGVSFTVQPTSNTSYHVTATLDGCQATDSTKVTVHPKVIIKPGKDTAICVGNEVELLADGENVEQFAWSNDLDNGARHLVKPSATTRYYVTATYHDCSVDASVLISVNPLPTPEITSSDADNTVCFGGKISLSTKDSYTKYEWSNNATTASIELTEQGSKTITITVTDANGCKNTTAQAITINALPNVTAQGNAVCSGKSTTLSGQGAISYVWSDGITDRVSFTPNASKTYIVTGTDANNCTDTATATVTVHALPNVTAQGKAICSGKSTSLSGQGAVSYVWSDGITDGVSFTPSASKTYIVTGTDANNCTDTANATVTVHALPNVTAQGKAICSGKSTSLSGQGAVSYVWSDGITDGVSFTPSATKTYIVTGTDSNNCTDTAKATVTVHALPNVTAQGKAICSGKTTSLSGQGAVSYVWSDGITDGVSFTPNATKTYIVTGTDANNCTDTANATVTINDLPQINIPLSNPYCDDALLEAQVSNVAVDTYTWSSGQTSAKATVTSTQSYTVTVVSKQACRSEKTVQVVINKTPHPQLVPQQTICAEKTAQLRDADAAVGQSYQWYRNDTLLNGQTQSVLRNMSIAGTYKLIATLGTCPATAYSSLIVNPLPTLQSGKKDICYNETSQTITLQGVTANWYADEDTTILLQRNQLSYTPVLDPSQTSLSIFASVTDANHCTSKPTGMTINRIPEYTGLHILGDDKRCESEKSPILLSASGFLSSKQWERGSLVFENYSTDSVTIVVNGFKAGLDTIYLSTTDKNGCIYSTQHIVYTSPQPKANFEWESNSGTMSVRYINTSDTAVLPDIHQALPNFYAWTFWKYEDETYRSSLRKDTIISYPYGYHTARLIVANSYGCIDSIKQTVFVDVHTAIYAPTAFTPNHPSDELSEFRPKAMNLETYELSIYDQWGTLLWYTNKLMGGQPAEGWNGTYNGQMMKSDTYVWRIKATFTNGQRWKSTDGSDIVWGNVVLLR